VVEVELCCCDVSQVGDGTTSVVLIAGEILKNCKSFIEDNVHPQIIARGLRKAIQLALTKIREIAVHVKKEDPK
jgi:T-complex protein 1 subunit eta